MTNIRVALVEDDEEFRKLTAAILNFYPDIECVGAYTDTATFSQVASALQPQVVLMDIGLPDESGIEAVRRLRPLHPGMLFVMLTSHPEPERTFEALRAGAMGYINKTSTPEKIAEAIREVAAGGSPMSRLVSRLVVEFFQKMEPVHPDVEKLTPTERAVLEDLNAGFAYKEIAANRFVDLCTVQTHVRHVYEKLQVHSRTEAVNKAFGKKKA